MSVRRARVLDVSEALRPLRLDQAIDAMVVLARELARLIEPAFDPSNRVFDYARAEEEVELTRSYDAQHREGTEQQGFLVRKVGTETNDAASPTLGDGRVTVEAYGLGDCRLGLKLEFREVAIELRRSKLTVAVEADDAVAKRVMARFDERFA